LKDGFATGMTVGREGAKPSYLHFKRGKSGGVKRKAASGSRIGWLEKIAQQF